MQEARSFAASRRRDQKACGQYRRALLGKPTTSDTTYSLQKAIKALKQLIAYYGYAFAIFVDECETFWAESENMSGMQENMLNILKGVLEGVVPLPHVGFIGKTSNLAN